MNLKLLFAPALAAAFSFSAATAIAQQYPQQQYPQQQQQPYPQQQQQPGYPQPQPGYQQPGYQQPGYQQPGYGDRGGWDNVPDEYHSEAQRRGFRDGMMGARMDFENHRQPRANNRNEFRHPPVPRYARAEYKDGYLRGYDVATRHMMERRDDHHDRDDHDRDHDHDGYRPN